MKRTILMFVVAPLALALLFSCSKGSAEPASDRASDKEVYDAESPSSAREPSSSGEATGLPDLGDSEPGNGPEAGAGIVTAGEWNDLANWNFWGKLAQGDFKQFNEDWGFYTEGRISVKVKDKEGKPACGVEVALIEDGGIIWKALTDNYGTAECWPSLFASSSSISADKLRLSINGREQEGKPEITWLQDEEVKVNLYELDSWKGMSPAVDIAFIVDATGSMYDEIEFLKQDLKDIIEKVMQSQSGMKIRTGAVFYRDEGDDYLTIYSNFNEELGVTRNFIQEQSAQGGGDFPEAVHSALEASLQNLSWNSSAHSRIAFMLLDAPAHDDKSVKESLHKSIEAYARAGIKLIPISASGIDKNTEALLRLFSISTNSTYVFITNDSGVGGDHIEATVGDYEVEKLNELMIRLINYYTKIVPAEVTED